jgi:hypothetical protein
VKLRAALDGGGSGPCASPHLTAFCSGLSPAHILVSPHKINFPIGPRLVLGPAAVAEAVELREGEALIDLACAWRIAAGIAGDLHMSDLFLQPHGHSAYRVVLRNKP